MSAALTIDTREFDATMREYAKVSSRDWAMIVNVKARDLMFKAGKAAPVAKAAQIRQAHMGNIPFLKRVAREYTAANPGQTRKEWLKGYKKAVRRAIGKRTRATGFAKAGWFRAANLLPDYREPRPGKEATRRPGKQFRRSIQAAARPAQPREMAVVPWRIDWASKGGSDAAIKMQIGSKAFRSAINIVEADMQAYMRRKAEQRARRASAK